MAIIKGTNHCIRFCLKRRLTGNNKNIIWNKIYTEEKVIIYMNRKLQIQKIMMIKVYKYLPLFLSLSLNILNALMNYVPAASSINIGFIRLFLSISRSYTHASCVHCTHPPQYVTTQEKMFELIQTVIIIECIRTKITRPKKSYCFFS